MIDAKIDLYKKEGRLLMQKRLPKRPRMLGQNVLNLRSSHDLNWFCLDIGCNLLKNAKHAIFRMSSLVVVLI